MAVQSALHDDLLSIPFTPSSTTRTNQELYILGKNLTARSVACPDGTHYLTVLPLLDRRNKDAKSAFEYALLRSPTQQFVTSNAREIKIADLFSGCGGLSLGVREACYAMGYRFTSCLAADFDANAVAVYRKNFSPGRALDGDLAKYIDGKIDSAPTQAERGLALGLPRLDVLLAGPPCQGHSDLNNHTRRNDTRNDLYRRVGRFAQIFLPIHILIENVPTVVHGKDRALDDTLETLIRLGYRVDAGVVDLSEIGVPQRRRRHVVFASLRITPSIADVVSRHRVRAQRSLRWAIRDLENTSCNGPFDEKPVHNAENLKRISYLLKHDMYDLPNRLRPTCHQSEHSYRSMYGRLSYDAPAQTITSGYGSPGQGRYIHPRLPRTLTAHEAARIQFFPDYFDFSGVKRTSLATMIGNAVPMKLSYAFSLEYVLR